MKALCAACAAATLLMSGCALPPTKAAVSPQAQASLWRGRLALRVESEPPPSQAQSFSAGFELAGSPQAGELTLYTPLGSTAAALAWSEQTAVLRSQGEVRHFASLNALVKEALGTELPVAALFAWLMGEPASVAGWKADLSQHALGRVTASRTTPPPQAELRLVLEK